MFFVLDDEDQHTRAAALQVLVAVWDAKGVHGSGGDTPSELGTISHSVIGFTRKATSYWPTLFPFFFVSLSCLFVCLFLLSVSSPFSSVLAEKRAACMSAEGFSLSIFFLALLVSSGPFLLGSLVFFLFASLPTVFPFGACFSFSARVLRRSLPNKMKVERN